MTKAGTSDECFCFWYNSTERSRYLLASTNPFQMENLNAYEREATDQWPSTNAQQKKGILAMPLSSLRQYYKYAYNIIVQGAEIRKKSLLEFSKCQLFYKILKGKCNKIPQLFQAHRKVINVKDDKLSE